MPKGVPKWKQEVQARREAFRKAVLADPELYEMIQDAAKWMRHLGEYRAKPAVTKRAI